MLREAEDAAHAAALSPVRVRLHFPDATILQASFRASQPLSAVQQLVAAAALPQLAPALYLYTTPPKTVLKDATATLYQLKLVPAAHLYVGCDAGRLKQQRQQTAAPAGGPGTAGPYLRPEVMALMQDVLPPELLPQQPQQEQGASSGAAAGGGGSSEAAAAAQAQRVMAAAAAASRADGSSRAAGGEGGEKKLPKWLQMGKK